MTLLRIFAKTKQKLVVTQISDDVWVELRVHI